MGMEFINYIQLVVIFVLLVILVMLKLILRTKPGDSTGIHSTKKQPKSYTQFKDNLPENVFKRLTFYQKMGYGENLVPHEESNFMCNEYTFPPKRFLWFSVFTIKTLTGFAYFGKKASKVQNQVHGGASLSFVYENMREFLKYKDYYQTLSHLVKFMVVYQTAIECEEWVKFTISMEKIVGKSEGSERKQIQLKGLLTNFDESVLFISCYATFEERERKLPHLDDTENEGNVPDRSELEKKYSYILDDKNVKLHTGTFDGSCNLDHFMVNDWTPEKPTSNYINSLNYVNSATKTQVTYFFGGNKTRSGYKDENYEVLHEGALMTVMDAVGGLLLGKTGHGIDCVTTNFQAKCTPFHLKRNKVYRADCSYEQSPTQFVNGKYRRKYKLKIEVRSLDKKVKFATGDVSYVRIRDNDD